MNSYSLFELHEYIKRVFLLNFGDAIWIKAEITQSNERKGHLYLNLVEYSEDGHVIASASAIVWRSKFLALLHHHGDIAYDLLQEGTEVRLLCKVNFDARYTYSLHIEDVDLEYTFGKLFISRQETIKRLHSEDLYDLNKELAFPTLIQKIAVISSKGAAGWADFKDQLYNNPQDYSYSVDFHSVAVQGQNAVREIVAALQFIHANHATEDYDCIVILRGGGSKLDLAAFDQYELAKDVAMSPIPVICAVGHETDTSVLDMISNQSVKTPTAAAEFLINWNLKTEEQLIGIADSIKSVGIEYLNKTSLQLQSIELSINRSTEYFVHTKLLLINNIGNSIRYRAIERFNTIQLLLVHLDKEINLKDVNQILAQGYTIFQQDGQWKKKRSEIDMEADHSEARFVDGSIRLDIQNKSSHNT